MSKHKIIGKGWCVVYRVKCPFSHGHGADGMVRCKCEGKCPEDGK